VFDNFYYIHLHDKRTCGSSLLARCIVHRRLGPTNDDAQSRLWRTSTWIVINCRLQRDDAIFSGVLVGRNPKVAPTRETSPEELPGNSLSRSHTHTLAFSSFYEASFDGFWPAHVANGIANSTPLHLGHRKCIVKETTRNSVSLQRDAIQFRHTDRKYYVSNKNVCAQI